MTTYPKTTFSSYNQPRENGSAVYAIWRRRAPGDCEMVGVLARTRHGMWRVDVSSRHYGQRITETAKFEDAKRYAREMLA